MIARHWRGWTTPENRDAYQNLLETRVFPGLANIEGYRGGYVLCSEATNEVEFVVINLFETLEAVQAFAGPDYTIAKFEPEARALLLRFETMARHYEVRLRTASL